METMRSAVPSDVPGVQGSVALQGDVALQGGVAVQDGVVVLPQWFDPRRAVHEQDIMCLVCGKCFRQLTNTHLRSHDLTTASYKIRFGYNRRRPLMSQVLLRLYTARAIQTSLASRIRCRPILSNPELRKLGGHRPIALEEVLARRDAQLRRREELRAAAEGASPPIAAREASKTDRTSLRGTATLEATFHRSRHRRFVDCALMSSPDAGSHMRPVRAGRSPAGYRPTLGPSPPSLRTARHFRVLRCRRASSPIRATSRS